MSVNKVILVGRLGRDPEIRNTNSGETVANFSLATDETYTNRAGEKVKNTEWHRCVVWSKLAEVAQNYLHKGSQVYVEGRIQTRKWEKDGQSQTSFEIKVDTLRLLDKAPVQAETAAPVVDDSYIPF